MLTHDILSQSLLRVVQHEPSVWFSHSFSFCLNILERAEMCCICLNSSRQFSPVSLLTWSGSLWMFIYFKVNGKPPQISLKDKYISSLTNEQIQSPKPNQSSPRLVLEISSNVCAFSVVQNLLNKPKRQVARTVSKHIIFTNLPFFFFFRLIVERKWIQYEAGSDENIGK